MKRSIIALSIILAILMSPLFTACEIIDSQHGEVKTRLEVMFMDALPEARIVDSLLTDMEGSGNQELIVAFEHMKMNDETGQLETSKSNVGVMFSDGVWEAVDVAADRFNFVFASCTDILTIDMDGKINVVLIDRETGEEYLYQVAFARMQDGFDVVISADKLS